MVSTAMIIQRRLLSPARSISSPTLTMRRTLASSLPENNDLVTCEFVGRGGSGGASVAKLTFNSPERLNALTVPMAQVFTQKVRELIDLKQELRAVVLTGAGRAFSAGGDIDWLIERHRKSGDKEANAATMVDFYKSFLVLRQLQCPVIAAVNGAAIGAGACVAVGGCDIRYASTKASLGFTFTKIGLHPGMAGTHFLPKLVGPSKAADMLLSGRVINAQEALDIGLVDKVGDDPVQDALEFAEELATNTSSAAVATCLQTLRLKQSEGLEESMRREAESQAITYATQDFLEGVVAVKEKRKPNFTGN